jgi:hypothetical protein
VGFERHAFHCRCAPPQLFAAPSMSAILEDVDAQKQLKSALAAAFAVLRLEQAHDLRLLEERLGNSGTNIMSSAGQGKPHFRFVSACALIPLCVINFCISHRRFFISFCAMKVSLGRVVVVDATMAILGGRGGSQK